jgi:hypothetical protein
VRAKVAVVSLAAVSLGCAHQSTPSEASSPQHVVRHLSDSEGATSLARVQAMLDSLQNWPAVSGAIVDRAASQDVAFASSQSEFDAIMRGALVMIVAVSRDPSELPPQLYVLGKTGNRLPLFRVAVLSPTLTKRLKVGGGFGTNVWAGVFHAPLVKRFNGTLMVDFGPNQPSFALQYNFPGHDAWVDSGSKNVSISADAIEAMCRREYPDFTIDSEFRQVVAAILSMTPQR